MVAFRKHCYKNVYIHGMLRSETGKKFSKMGMRFKNDPNGLNDIVDGDQIYCFFL